MSVVAGAGDNAAAACGVGIMQEGQGFVSLGTSGVLLTARSECNPLAESAVHTFCHALPNTWYQMGVILSATDSLNWLSSIIGRSPSQLTAELNDKIDGPSSEKFYPYLSGERTPLNDAHIRGGFAGLSTNSTAIKLTQAVMEGVAFALCDCLEALKKAGPVRNNYWLLEEVPIPVLVRDYSNFFKHLYRLSFRRRIWCSFGCRASGYLGKNRRTHKKYFITASHLRSN